MSVIESKIFVDGMGYLGESEDTYDTNCGGEGWHIANHNQLNVLEFAAGKAGIKIVGIRNLLSHLEKILKRVKDGEIKPEEIHITIDSNRRMWCPDCFEIMIKAYEQNEEGDWGVRWLCECEVPKDKIPNATN